MTTGRLAVMLGSLSGANILLSFLYQWYLVTTLGAGLQMDALVAGMMVPQLVLAIASQSLSHVLVPLLSNLGEDEFHRASWNFFQGMILIFATFTAVLYVTAPVWVEWTVPGFSEGSLALTVELVRIQLWGIVFTAASSVLWAAHHARDRFRWVEISAGISHAVGLGLLILLLPRGGVHVAAWIIVFKTGLALLLLLPVLGPFRPMDPSSPSLKLAWLRLRPLIVGSSYYKTGTFVDRFLASMAPAGGMTLFHLANQLYSAGTTVLNRAIVTPLIPRLARAAEAESWTSFRRLWRRRLALIGSLALAGSAVLVLIGPWLLELLFGHNRVGPEEVRLLWVLLLALTGMWVGSLAGQVLSGSFYAMGNTTTPTRVGVVGFTVGVAAKFVGFYFAGLIGIALGTSLYYMGNAVALYLLLEVAHRKNISAGGVLANPRGATIR